MSLTDKQKRQIEMEEEYRFNVRRTLKPEYSSKNPTLAGVLSFLIPGLGQVYNGDVWKGILIFFLSPTIIVWIYGIFDAYKQALIANGGNVTKSGGSFVIRNKSAKNFLKYIVIISVGAIILMLFTYFLMTLS